MRSTSQNSKLKSDVSGRRLRTHVQHGFTFMELMIVMVIIAILAAVAIPHYMTHLRHAREVVLRQDLWAMRRAIDYFSTDKEKPPTSLEELQSQGYLREIPKDPMCPPTEDCPWTLKTEAVGDVSGITNVNSSAPGTDSNQVPYSQY